jgi:DNA topoisomerase-1
MRGRHVEVHGSTLTFQFQGKSRVKHAIRLTNRRLARIVKRCQDLPGYELFQYLDSDGVRHSIDSGDVNDYLRQITSDDFTAKDFRTWAGTILACVRLREFEAFDSPTQAKKNVVQAIKAVATSLGNTPSVCRKCYVHPAVLDCYLNGTLTRHVRRTEGEVVEESEILRQEEMAVSQMLRKWAKAL